MFGLSPQETLVVVFGIAVIAFLAVLWWVFRGDDVDPFVPTDRTPIDERPKRRDPNRPRSEGGTGPEV